MLPVFGVCWAFLDVWVYSLCQIWNISSHDFFTFFRCPLPAPNPSPSGLCYPFSYLFVRFNKLPFELNCVYLFIYLFQGFIYLFMRDTKRDRGRDTGRGSRIHAGRLMRDLILDPRIMPWAEGDAQPLSYPGVPHFFKLRPEVEAGSNRLKIQGKGIPEEEPTCAKALRQRGACTEMKEG